MDGRKVDSALNGVDAQMLELLSEQFLYPDSAGVAAATATAKSTAVSRLKPKGRPEFVPGAMNFETMQRFMERNEAMNRDAAADVSTSLAPYTSDAESSSALYVSDILETAAGRKNQRSNNEIKIEKQKSKTKRKVKGKKGSSTPNQSEYTGGIVSDGKKRKGKFKNLPVRKKNLSVNSASSKEGKKRLKGGNLDLQKYYRTELLTADEEYSLGMKVQFMMQCKAVHEGLSTRLMRIPTIEEWARACGFIETDPDFVVMEGDNQIRPKGYESMFEEVDPNMFVGNGLAQSVGPGRGRGRVKKPPPFKLEDFFDDSKIRAKKRAKSDKGEEQSIRQNLKPINRGTAKDFIELMMTAKEAKQRMVQSNMRLVVSIARKYANVGVSLQDLVQEGSLGLSRAAEKFQPSKGFKFSTYASWWIQQAVFRSIAYHSRTIRLPVHVHNLLNKIRKIRNTLQRSLGRAPTNEEMAEQLDMPLDKYNKMIRLTRRSISLEMPKYQSNPKDLGHESDDLLGDTIDAGILEDESTPEKRVDRGLFHKDLKEMLEILDDDERKVINARYGLKDGLTRTVTVVAAQMKQWKAWVRSQECRALRKLRRPWYEKTLKEHQDAFPHSIDLVDLYTSNTYKIEKKF